MCWSTAFLQKRQKCQDLELGVSWEGGRIVAVGVQRHCCLCEWGSNSGCVLTVGSAEGLEKADLEGSGAPCHEAPVFGQASLKQKQQRIK